MIFFRKKKEEDVEEIKSLVEGKKPTDKLLEVSTEENVPEFLESIGGKFIEEPEEKESIITPETQTVEEKKPAFAPLFVKIDNYRSILNTIGDLKTTVIMIKNTIGLQKEIENIRDENRKLLETAINKVDKKIVKLDSEFLRPEGLEEEFPPPIHETEGLEGVVTDLKKQIESLKSELQTIS